MIDCFKILSRYVNYLISIVSILCMTLSCRNTDQIQKITPTANTLMITLDPIETGLLLPGGYFAIRGSGFLEGATFEVQLDLLGTQYLLESRLSPTEGLEARWPVNLGTSLQQGLYTGTLTVKVKLLEAEGSAQTSWTANLAQRLAPQLSTLSPWSAPNSARPVAAARMLKEGEGETILILDGVLTTTSSARTINVRTLLQKINVDRSAAQWIADPREWGIYPGSFEGNARLMNRSHVGEDEGPVIPVLLSYRTPQITGPLHASLSRGQLLPLTGWGFLGGEERGFTLLSFNGTFEPYNTLHEPIAWSDLTLETSWVSGDELSLILSPTLDEDCEGPELGAEAGILSGSITPSIILGEEIVEGEPVAFELEVRPTKQVVFLSFLPAFIDSLRLFGLRNVSGRVVDEIIRVVERDYEGINLEVRREPPLDFELFSIVEIGGPDPNAQDLFGLDNTTGLDLCNQRLNDYLAGRNADSGGTFGGIFVESFLNLSPKKGDNPLADPLFDQIFDPVMSTPARIDETGERAEQIDRAIKALGNLIGNTLSHEIGHSLGLPMYPGCGQYHNAPGELQIMDCGRDRPFVERVGLDPRGFAQWTTENRQYLERILPLR